MRFELRWKDVGAGQLRYVLATFEGQVPSFTLVEGTLSISDKAAFATMESPSGNLLIEVPCAVQEDAQEFVLNWIRRVLDVGELALVNPLPHENEAYTLCPDIAARFQRVLPQLKIEVRKYGHNRVEAVVLYPPGHEHEDRFVVAHRSTRDLLPRLLSVLVLYTRAYAPIHPELTLDRLQGMQTMCERSQG